MKKNFFERNPKAILLIINSLFIGLLIFILNLNIFQDAANSEKYSLIDSALYQIRCEGKRHIVLRENKPNQNTHRVPPYDKNAKYPFRTDENGFIQPTKIHENPDLNIFFVGGSTTECENVDELYRFPHLAGRILEEKTGKKINSYNGGKSGNNSIHSINNLLNKIAPMHPNFVVRMENINDLSTLLYEETYWNRNKSRSNLACFSKNYSSARNFRNEWEQSPFRDMIMDVAHQNKIKAEYKRILEIFVEITKAVGATPVLMTQANKIENDPNFSINRENKDFDKAYRKLYTDFQKITREVAAEKKILLIDLAKDLPGSDKYLYDSVHLNNEGSKLVSEIIARKLEKDVVNYKVKK